jgi:hypothetical protein
MRVLLQAGVDYVCRLIRVYPFLTPNIASTASIPTSDNHQASTLCARSGAVCDQVAVLSVALT